MHVPIYWSSVALSQSLESNGAYQMQPVLYPLVTAWEAESAHNGSHSVAKQLSDWTATPSLWTSATRLYPRCIARRVSGMSYNLTAHEQLILRRKASSCVFKEDPNVAGGHVKRGGINGKGPCFRAYNIWGNL